MKASNGMAGLAATFALAASGACIAEIDGADWSTGYQSSKTRAQVQQEYLDAKSQGLLMQGDSDHWMSDRANMDIGARGPAGSRYQGRTRDEVREELIEHRRTHNPNDPNDIYFGG